MTKDKDDIKYIIIQALQAENNILDEAPSPPPPPRMKEIVVFEMVTQKWVCNDRKPSLFWKISTKLPDEIQTICGAVSTRVSGPLES